ncbi:hypothetical protein M758_11G065700 [Ceratodon purpureus]|nr:hypothetical protein M758_11G065700 [Ceratodon purpureus]
MCHIYEVFVVNTKVVQWQSQATLPFKSGIMAPKKPPQGVNKGPTQSQIDDIVMNIMQARPNMLDATLEAAALKVVQSLQKLTFVMLITSKPQLVTPINYIFRKSHGKKSRLQRGPSISRMLYAARIPEDKHPEPDKTRIACKLPVLTEEWDCELEYCGCSMA